MRRGIHIEMAHHPQVILDTMEQVRPGVRRIELGRKLRLVGGVALMIVPFPAFIFSATRLSADLGFSFCVMSGFGFIVGLALLFNLPETHFLREHFETAYQILHTLQDDTGRKGQVVGWLDLSGPRQEEKRIRTARSAAGKSKEYYRDPWFKAKIKLVDGNLLRLALEDKVKTKAGSVVAHRTYFTARLVVNPNLYRVAAIPSTWFPLPNPVLSHLDGVLTVTAQVDPRRLPVAEMLETLKVLYRHLEPVAQGPGLNTYGQIT